MWPPGAGQFGLVRNYPLPRGFCRTRLGCNECSGLNIRVSNPREAMDPVRHVTSNEAISPAAPGPQADVHDATGNSERVGGDVADLLNSRHQGEAMNRPSGLSLSAIIASQDAGRGGFLGLSAVLIRRLWLVVPALCALAYPSLLSWMSAGLVLVQGSDSPTGPQHACHFKAATPSQLALP